MLAAIFVVPICLFVNAFLLGRFLKRIRISIDSFLSTIIGFIFLLDVLYIFDIVLYALNANIWVYLIIYSIIQVALIISYIINWKYIYITTTFNLKKFLTFIIVLGLIILISWLSFRETNSQFGTDWIKTIQSLGDDRSFSNAISFRTAENDVVSHLSSINIFNIFWIYIFQVKTFAKCYKFCWWCWTICAAGIIACLATWLTPQYCGVARTILSPFIIVVYFVVILAFIESFAVVDSWLMILMLIYLAIMVKQPANSKFKLFFLGTTMMGFIAVSSTAYFVTISMWVFTIYWAIRNKENSINYIVCLLWPFLLAVFGLSSINLPLLLPIVDIILLIVMCVIIGLFINRGAPAWSTRFARSLSRSSKKIVYTVLGLIIAAVLVANFFIFNEVYKWKGANINYKNFLAFTYRYIWAIPIKSDEYIALVNGLFYAFFLALIISFIAIRNVKKAKLYPIAKTDPAIKLSVTSAAIFINPLVIHILKYATEQVNIGMTLNTLNLNILFVAPLFILLLKINYNVRARVISSWSYDWY